MAQLHQFVRYVGGAVALLGLALSAAFVGPRTADPLASSLLGPFSVRSQILGVVLGLVGVALGLAIVGRAGGRNS